jgi:hypothetical protein
MKKHLFTSICMGALMSALCAGFVSCESKPQPVRVSTIELQATTLTLEVGERQTLTAIVLPTDAENKTVSWKSSDESIAEVSSSGEVTPIAAGTIIITATTADGEKTASCTVTVMAPEPEFGDVPFEVYSFGEESSAQWVNLDYNEFGSLLVINSDSELQKYVEGDYPPVDFTKKTRLLAFANISGGLFEIDVKFRRESYPHYVMTSTIRRETFMDYVGEWQIAIVVDKLPHDRTFKLRMLNRLNPVPEPQGKNVSSEVYSFEESLSTQWVNLDYEAYYPREVGLHVINSDSELQKYVEGDYPPIDFTKKTLLLAYGSLSGDFMEIEVKFQHESDQNYVMTACGTRNLVDSIDEWEIAIIVDKLPHDSKIRLRRVDRGDY